MKLALVQNPHSNDRLWVIDPETNQKQSCGNIYKSELIRPLKLTGSDKDKNIVVALKVWAKRTTGFSSWQEAAAVLDSVDDIEALLDEHNTDLEFLLAQ